MQQTKFSVVVYAIVDCNNFYCSCERLFKPHLDDKPVVVLSNNDGCIVSRSDEVKALGVKMAVPYFMAKPVIEANNVATFSSNYNLYGDLSWRVMETLRTMVGVDNVEVYSVDEAFINLREFAAGDLQNTGMNIRQTAEQWTGIKLSVGIAPTKVLCKIANHLAKKHKADTQCVVVLDTVDKIKEALESTPIGDVWGVGRQYQKKLVEIYGIYNALSLSNQSEDWAYKNLGGVVGVRLLKELNSEPCITMKDPLVTKKMIATTRMFGNAINNLSDIKEAVATYTSKAAEKLRRQKSAANVISVFVVAKEQDHNLDFHHGGTMSLYSTLPFATSATNELIKPAISLVERLYKKDNYYKKAGVMLSGLVPDEKIQANLFAPDTNKHKGHLMDMIDNVNFGMRNDILKFATSGTTRDWKMRMEMRSPKYTTRWGELFEVS